MICTCRAKKEMQQQHEAESRAMQSRIADLDKESRDLRDTKYALESRLSELTHKLDSRQSQVDSLSEENARSQQQFQTISRCAAASVNIELHVKHQ